MRDNYDGNLDFMFRDELVRFTKALNDCETETAFNYFRTLEEWLPSVAESLRDEFYRAKAFFIYDFYTDEISDWEFNFLGSFEVEPGKGLSDKQIAKINRIAERIGVAV